MSAPESEVERLADVVFFGDPHKNTTKAQCRTIAEALLASDWLAFDRARVAAEAWDEALVAVFKRLTDSYSHGDERGEDWAPMLGSLIKVLRDEQPIPNPHRAEARQ